MKLSFGKYKDQDVTELTDDKYIQWLSYQSFISEEMRDYIIEKMLPNSKMTFGRHVNKTILEIKKNDEKYYNWMKEKLDAPWVKFI